MSILQRTFVTAVDESDGRRDGAINVAAVVASVSGVVALLTGVLGVITLSH